MCDNYFGAATTVTMAMVRCNDHLTGVYEYGVVNSIERITLGEGGRGGASW